MQQSDRKRGVVPVLYGMVALVVFVALVPSVLRPPPDEAQASAEFSPDAPPDEDPDVIIQTLEQARSQTAGGLRVSGEPDVTAPPVVTTPPPVIAQTRGGCAGDPPRQIEAVYAAPCEPVFVGDNGGATARGVTGDEIRIALWVNDSHDYGGKGRIADGDNDGAAPRSIRVIEQYLNQNYEFYGRKMALIRDEEPGNDPAENRAFIVGSDAEWGEFFLGYTQNANSISAGSDIGVTMLGGWQLNYKTYTDNNAFGFQMDGTKLTRLNVEYICKRLAGLPARWAGTIDIQSQIRKFGLLYDDHDGDSGARELPALVKSRCGLDMLAYQVSYDERLSTAMAAMRADGVTTVGIISDELFPAVATAQADAQSWFPEWYVPGFNGIDDPGVPGVLGYSRAQWSNAFGISPREMRQDSEDSDWYRAYKTMDPDGEGTENPLQYAFPVLVMMANGIQRAGPNLTPETFREGLLSVPPRTAEDPTYICCNISADDLTYGDLIMEMYWVPDGTSINCDICQGSYIYPECGKRYGEGQIATGEPAMFEGGCRAPNDGRSQGPSTR